MNTNTLFATLNGSLFAGGLSHQQDSITAILNAWGKHQGTDLRQLAYILGTVYHEAGKGMRPVREGFSADNAAAVKYVTDMYNRHQIRQNYALPDAATGQSYYGRGFVQITWKWNYAAFEKLLGLPLVANPDMALDVDTSAQIAALGMLKGVFTGKKLADYFNAQTCDWLNARRIINGTDRAALVAGYAQKFYQALTTASS